MDIPARYQRNLGALTPGEQAQLGTFRVCVIGCGGIGGHLLELLARLGIGHITAVDGDCFDATNLNRQLLSTMDTLGQSKALAAKQRLEAINPTIRVEAHGEFLTEANAAAILKGHHIVLDALDSISHRLLLQKVCRELEIPLIHGAVEGWFAQISTVLPGEDTLSRVYPGYRPAEAREPSAAISTPAFVPAFAASVQVSEALKVLLRKGEILNGRILFADLLNNRFDILQI